MSGLTLLNMITGLPTGTFGVAAFPLSTAGRRRAKNTLGVAERGYGDRLVHYGVQHLLIKDQRRGVVAVKIAL